MIKWTYEACYKEAKKASSKSDFSKKSPRAYEASLRHKWIDNFDWFVNPRVKWTYETCYKEAKKYTYRRAFRKGNQGAYRAAESKKWLDDYVWFEKKKYKWDEFACWTEAKKYKTKTEFKDQSSGAYESAKKNNWLEKYTWLTPQKHIGDDYVVYAYIDKESHAIYVGLTWRPERRFYTHKTSAKSSVYKFFNSIGKPVPDPTILKNGLSADLAQYYEEFFVKKYKKKNWLLINKVKTGSLGGTNILWNFKNCREEALKYKKVTDFAKLSGGSFSAARRNKWLQSFTWLYKKKNKPPKFWNYSTCFAEAKKYLYYKDFRTISSVAYSVARKNRWLKDYTWLVQKFKWTPEECFRIAKECTTVKEFANKNRSAYTTAWKNGWLDEYTWFERVKCKPRGFWTKDRCYQEAKKYESSCAFNKGAGGAYKAALRNRWIGDYIWFAGNKRNLN